MLNNLVLKRKKSKLTQKELAELLGITERQYQNLEAGTSEGSVPLWKTLAQMLNCTIDHLLEQADEISQQNNTL